MNTQLLYTRAEVAAALGCHPNTVTRIARANSIGRRGVYLASDLARLRQLIRPSAGCPLFVEGNTFSGNRRKSNGNNELEKPKKTRKKQRK